MTVMGERLKLGSEVLTVCPEKESTDWALEVKGTRRWNTNGRVIGISDCHGLVYNVAHEGGGESWYEPRELMPRPPKPKNNWVRLRTNHFD